MTNEKLIESLENTASELEALADTLIKQASEDTNPYSAFLDGIVRKLGLE